MAIAIAPRKILSIALEAGTRFKSLMPPLYRIFVLRSADDFLTMKKSACVSIEQSGFSVAYGTRFLSSISIKKIKKYALPAEKQPNPEELSSAVALALSELNIGNVPVNLCIPRSWTIIKTIELPSAAKESISNVIAYELDRFTPLSSESALYDFRILSEDENKIAVLIAAARADLISAYKESFKNKGIFVNSVTVNLSGKGTLCFYMDKKRDAIFIDVTNSGYEGAFIAKGTLSDTFYDRFPQDTDENSKADAIASKIEEILNSIKEKTQTPQIVMSLKDAVPSLKEMLKLRVRMPFSILEETDLRLRLSAEQKTVSYSAIGGLLELLWPMSKGLNLLDKGRKKESGTPMIVTGIFMLAIFVLGILYLIIPLNTQKKKLERLDQEIALKVKDVREIEAVKKEIDEINNEILKINNFKTNRPMVLSLLKELTSVLPKTTWLTRAHITETTVLLEGYASSATELLPKIEASKYFGKAEFSSPTFRDVRLNSERFIIKMEIEGIKKDEGEKLKDAKK